MANRSAGKASSDSPALKPYRGKPAVRNFRGDDGNVGIIRSPVRAIVLPDSRHSVQSSGRPTRRSILRVAGDLSGALVGGFLEIAAKRLTTMLQGLRRTPIFGGI